MLIETGSLLVDLLEPRTVVFVHGKDAPASVSFEPVMQLYAELFEKPERLWVLVFTDGGTPSLSQRKQAFDLFTGKMQFVRSAVITELASARFVVSAMSLIADGIQSFSPEKFNEALQFLDYPTGTAPLVLGRLRAMQRAHAGKFTSFDRALAASPSKR